jgi:benzoyl-CoA 2,3-dioxygenase component A
MAESPAAPSLLARQHVIDPEVCIRCNTCEATCPVGAVTHDERNYVVRFDVCNACGNCIAPCPTGAIDHWRQVLRAKPYTVAEQLSWDSLPPDEAVQVDGREPIPQEVLALSSAATAGQGGAVPAPRSAAHPLVNLYSIHNPAIATVTGNLRLTGEGASADVRHIVLDFGALGFPVLEGQTIGIVPPGRDAAGRAHHLRLYSVASPRDGERSGYNNLALTVKRVTEDHDGRPVPGVCSNYLCDLERGDSVQVTGPYGTSFLMPNHAGSSIMMICTGTGSAPMRAMTERRRRKREEAEGGELLLFFGARRPQELPYHGPLMKLDHRLIDVNLAYSRVPDQPRRYVQDLIRERAADVARLLADPECYVYVCGLKGMEQGVDQAFDTACRQYDLDWSRLRPQLLTAGRLHIETY